MNFVSVVMGWMLAASATHPIACDLSALTPDQRTRHEALGQRLKSAIVSTEELSNGFRFTLSPELSIVEAATWVDLERRCCPFLEFTIGLGRKSGPVWVQLTGSRETKAFVREAIVPARRSSRKGGK